MKPERDPRGRGPNCTRCDGCGRIANTNEGEPWSAWLELPLQSSIAVLIGAVKPIPCPVCGGTGKKPDRIDQPRSAFSSEGKP